jgi:hypothetical protein
MVLRPFIINGFLLGSSPSASVRCPLSICLPLSVLPVQRPGRTARRPLTQALLVNGWNLSNVSFETFSAVGARGYHRGLLGSLRTRRVRASGSVDRAVSLVARARSRPGWPTVTWQASALSGTAVSLIDAASYGAGRRHRDRDRHRRWAVPGST